MSGIFAWWHINKNEYEIINTLNKIKPSLKERGEGKFIQKRDVVFFIWDGQKLSESKNGDIVAVVDGNFYDKSKNYEGDELIYLYEKYGTNAISHLNGEFAFFLWDRKSNLLWLGRDGAGGRGVCYCINNGEVILSSEAKGIINGGWSDRFNQRAMMQCLSMQYIDPGFTLFENINQVKPGGEVRIENKNGWRKEGESIWFEWFLGGDKKEQKIVDEEFEYWFGRAVEKRVGENDICVHLSGGCDSSAVLIQALECGRNIHPFTVRFKNGLYDESEMAKTTANKLGLYLNEVEVGVDDIFNNFEKSIYRVENVAINGHLSAKYLLNKEVLRKNIKTCISGEGSDEAMLGYPFFVNEINDEILKANQISVGSMIPFGDRLDFDLCGERPMWLLAKQGIGYNIHQVLRDDFLSENKKWMNRFGEGEIFNQPHPMQKSSAMWARYALGGYILPSLANRVEMGFGVNGRVPFLDRDFLNASGGWSVENVMQGEGKTPIRNYLIKKKFTEIASRKKHPFEAPPILSDEKIRKKIIDLFMDEKSWYDTPIDDKKVVEIVKKWHDMDMVGYQRQESIVCLMLSVCFLNKNFNLR